MLIAYLLCPHMPADSNVDLPEATWPYWPEDEFFDPLAVAKAAEEYHRHWADWEKSRHAGPM